MRRPAGPRRAASRRPAGLGRDKTGAGAGSGVGRRRQRRNGGAVPPAVIVSLQTRRDFKIDGDARRANRPLAELLTAIAGAGCRCIDGDALPITVARDGALAANRHHRRPRSSSAIWLVSLLLASPRTRTAVTVVHDGPPFRSKPHLEITVLLASAGGDLRRHGSDRWSRRPPALARPLLSTVEPDSNSRRAAFSSPPLRETGGSWTITCWPSRPTQPGRLLTGPLSGDGASVTAPGDGLTVTGCQRRRDVVLDAELHWSTASGARH